MAGNSNWLSDYELGELAPPAPPYKYTKTYCSMLVVCCASACWPQSMLRNNMTLESRNFSYIETMVSEVEKKNHKHLGNHFIKLLDK